MKVKIKIPFFIKQDISFFLKQKYIFSYFLISYDF